MLKNKILFKITGSIAAFKSAFLISKLVQNGYEVNVAVSKDALKFIGEATLEGLTGNVVYTDLYESGRMMSHINLMKWADLIIVVPATANTINKFANGIGDNLITSLFLAFDFSKPYLIAPAMNTNMLLHPSTQQALSKLKNWGIKILPTASGNLACGDVGQGKLIEPDEIFEHIKKELNAIKKKLKILVTAGGTRENIDGVRYLTNLSTGRTAANIAQYFINEDYEITYIHSPEIKLPNGNYKKIEYSDFMSLDKIIKDTLKKNKIDIIIHNAAVSDYSVESISTNDGTLIAPLTNKINSNLNKINLNLKLNFKIVDKIKSYSKNKNIKLVAFKFTNTMKNNEVKQAVINLQNNSKADLIIHNSLKDRSNSTQNNFEFYVNGKKLRTINSSVETGKLIESLLIKNTVK